MRKSLSYLAVLVMISIFSITSVFAQVNTINGNVKSTDSTETISSVSITVKGSGSGTTTDDNGNFKLNTPAKLPLTLLITSVGYEEQEVMVNTTSEFVHVNLKPTNILGQEIVVASTRTPARILESPVTIERISAANIRNSASPNYYDIIGNLKGVDVVTASLLFKTPSTRGFNGSGNLRLNQIVDGMDNQAPGLNFALGGVVGLTELDVESVELLPGASSALYGPGGMNGALLINGKDPFKYQGFSAQIKTGIMHVDTREREPAPYYNWSMRWAKKVSDKFAFKVSGELIQAKDWVADDFRDYKRLGTTGNVVNGTRETDPNYDGINVYGDETSVDIKTNVLNPLAALAPFLAPYINNLPPSILVSRTGYLEKQVVNPNSVNFRASGLLNYKITERISVLAEGYWGTGNTVYTGSDRYSLKNLKMGQYKLEFNGPDWFLRGYTTQENAGESYNSTVTARLFNEVWKPSGGSTGWYAQYGQAFLQNKLGGLSDIAAHNAARAVADVGRPAAGSAQFRQIFDQVRKIPIKNGGGLFLDKTNLYNVEGQYDFSHYTEKFAEIIVGGNYKRYLLNSEGTLFADSAGKIGINEVGVYTQLTRKFMDDKLKLIVSGRYDKNQNFDGRFTPRISAVIRIAPENNLRISYQQAYRFASTQQQWINLRVGGGTRLLGGLKTFQDFYNFSGNPVYDVTALQTSGTLTVRKFDKFKAETVNSFEGGYKGLMMNQKLLIDVYGYYGIYQNFIARTLVAQSANGVPPTGATLLDPTKVTIYSVPTNITSDVKTYGYGISLDYALPLNFRAGANFSSDKLSEVPPNFVAAFNAPLYRVGASIGNNGFGIKKAFGFNISYKYQDRVDYEGDFATGEVPAYNTVDAQVSYKFPMQKLLLKIGGTNIFNQYYRNGFGNATVGGLYYVSLGFNVF